jgi:hypothetical protein
MRIEQVLKLRSPSWQLTALLALTVLAAGFLPAQETTGSITGIVFDPSGAGVPNARVDVSAANLPRAVSTVSGSTGDYLISNVPVGEYAVTVSVTGFATVKKAGVNVVLGRATRLDFGLEVGQVTESVVVSADAVMVDTQSSSSAVNVDRTFFDILPKGRSFYDLAAIAPGARPERSRAACRWTARQGRRTPSTSTGWK